MFALSFSFLQADFQCHECECSGFVTSATNNSFVKKCEGLSSSARRSTGGRSSRAHARSSGGGTARGVGAGRKAVSSQKRQNVCLSEFFGGLFVQRDVDVVNVRIASAVRVPTISVVDLTVVNDVLK
jgi:hypothetical protein